MGNSKKKGVLVLKNVTKLMKQARKKAQNCKCSVCNVSSQTKKKLKI